MFKLWKMLQGEKSSQSQSVATISNQVNLTDDELSLILASLELTETVYESILENNNEMKTNIRTKEHVEKMKELNHRLNSEYNQYYFN